MWKFQDFAVTHILREIKVDETGGLKSAILTNLKVLKFELNINFHFLKAETNQINKIQSS